MSDEPTIGNLMLELAEKCEYFYLSHDASFQDGAWCVHVQKDIRAQSIYDQNLLAALVAALAWEKGLRVEKGKLL